MKFTVDVHETTDNPFEDEVYFVVTIVQPSGTRDVRLPPSGGVNMEEGARWEVDVGEVELNAKEEASIRFACWDDDRAPVAEIKVIAEALRASGTAAGALLADVLSAMGIILGKNKDDLIGAGAVTVWAVMPVFGPQKPSPAGRGQSFESQTAVVASPKVAFTMRNDGADYTLRVDLVPLRS